jgi:23S rRNA (guanosine2251-2'-O)-methyltransferase
MKKFTGKPNQSAKATGGERPQTLERSNDTMIYGTNPVTEALRSHPQRIRRILVAEGTRDARFSEIFKIATSEGVPIEHVPRRQIDRVADGEKNHQGIVAIAAAAEYLDEDDLIDLLPADALILLLDGIEDPRNLGAILRTAECAGTDGVFLPNRRAAGLTDTAVKTAAGATEYLRIARTGNLNRLIERLKERGIWIVGADANAVTDYTDWDWRLPTALVLGSEGSGLHRLVRENCDCLVRIPMFGRIDSLNVSVAAGVILFEARRQRRNPAKEVEEG